VADPSNEAKNIQKPLPPHAVCDLENVINEFVTSLLCDIGKHYS
jgi:hypothetical protein